MIPSYHTILEGLPHLARHRCELVPQLRTERDRERHRVIDQDPLRDEFTGDVLEDLTVGGKLQDVASLGLHVTA